MMDNRLTKWHFMVVGMWLTAVLFTACNSSDGVADTAVPGEPTLNATQQAIAAVLTHQAENPRDTREPNRWVIRSQTATAEAALSITVTPTLNPTQEAIAAILTYQAENPRPTRERWQGANLALTAQAESRQTPQPTATATPTVVPTQTATPRPRSVAVEIPAGTAPQLDGRFSPDEWADAASQTIEVDETVKVQTYIQHDAANLYIAFTGLDQGETALFPELLLDTGFDSSMTWDEDDFWFHVSTNLCQGSGPAALWQQCGAADGWRATNFSQSAATIEMQIPYERVGLQAGANQPIAISWAVLELTAADEELRLFWPETAVFTQPATWAKGTAVGGW